MLRRWCLSGGTNLLVFFVTPSAGRPLLWRRPGPYHRHCALPPLSRRPPSSLLPPAPPHGPRPTSHGSVSHSGLATPPPLLEKLCTGMYVDFQSILHASEGSGAALHPEPVVHSLTTQGITLDIVMAPRFCRTRILDYLTWSQAWVVYFEATVRYHPHLLPHLAYLVYQVDMNRYARDYLPYAWVAFDAEFRQSMANNPGVFWDRLHSMAFHRHLHGAPPASPRSRDDGSSHPAVRQPPAGRPMPPIGLWAARQPLPGLQRPSVHAGHLPMRTPCCTRCGGPHPAVSCPPQ